MSQEVKIDPSIIKKTQDTLGRIIQAPSLTEKLLNRPPVQFIQDIVKSVIKTTSFMKGLYSSEELDGGFLKTSKENKLLFLNKLIVIVGLAVGEQLNVKSSKIAAGSEADKTNELLQALAKAINMKPDNDELVKKALKKLKHMDEPDGKSDKKKEENDEKERDRDRGKDREKSIDKDRDRDRDKEKDRERERRSDREKDKEKDRERDRDRDREKDRERDREREKNKSKDRDDREKSRTKDRERDKTKEREKDREKERERDRDKDRERDKDKERERDRDKERERDRDKERERDRDREKNRDKDRERNRDADNKESSKSKHREESRKERDRDESNSKENKGSRDKPERLDDDEVFGSQKNDLNDDNNESSNTSRRRPSSARGPRVQIEREDSTTNARKNNDADEESRNLVRPTTARPGAPRPRLANESEDANKSGINSLNKTKAKSTVKANGSDDSDDDFIVKENKFQDDDKKNFDIENELRKRGQYDQNDDEDENHGALVKKILESKEQLEYGSELNKTKGDFQKPVMQMDMQRKKEKERVQKEIDKLKESIQTLTKASIPLGRTLDFLQEDIDMMQKEIVKWSDEYEQNTKALKRQQAESQSFLEPYKAALGDIENQIEEQSEKIANVKRKILINEEKISKLLFNVGKN